LRPTTVTHRNGQTRKWSIGQQLIEIAFQQDVAGEGFFDGGFLRVRAGYVDAAEAVGGELDGRVELDSVVGEMSLDAMPHLGQTPIELGASNCLLVWRGRSIASAGGATSELGGER
jgi:hypothetical protein